MNVPEDLAPYGYERSRYIGRGQFASAYIVKRLPQQGGGDSPDDDVDRRPEYVAKVIPLDHLGQNDKKLAQQEIEVLRLLVHPHIVSYVDSFLVQASVGRGLPPQSALVIVTDYCDGGDLRVLIRARSRAEPREFFAENVIMRWFGQTLLALQHVHRARILHRDLKTSNLFLSKDQATLKIGDFGISRVLDSTAEAATTVVGTPYYMSPEVCRSEPYRDKSDVWALGCVLYELCMLRHPFESDSLLGLVYRIVSESYDPISEVFSKDLRDLVRALLSKSAEDRPHVDAILGGAYAVSFLPPGALEENLQMISPVVSRDRFASSEGSFDKVSQKSVQNSAQNSPTSQVAQARALPPLHPAQKSPPPVVAQARAVTPIYTGDKSPPSGAAQARAVAPLHPAQKSPQGVHAQARALPTDGQASALVVAPTESGASHHLEMPEVPATAEIHSARSSEASSVASMEEEGEEKPRMLEGLNANPLPPERQEDPSVVPSAPSSSVPPQEHIEEISEV